MKSSTGTICKRVHAGGREGRRGARERERDRECVSVCMCVQNTHLECDVSGCVWCVFGREEARRSSIGLGCDTTALECLGL